MAPLHVKRKFWLELTFLGVLLYLVAGVLSQRKDVVASHKIIVPAISPGAVVAAIPPPVLL
jgi:hypothetical protein